METKIKTGLALLSCLLLLTACPKGKTAKTIKASKINEAPAQRTPTFNPDSAYHYIQTQTNFGPRVPNTSAHKACAKYLSAQLSRFGAKVSIQEAELLGYDGTRYESQNIIGAFNPDKADRILLCAHWDTRHVADYDPDETKQHSPFDGANDGASGVGVLLEIARQIGQKPLDYGIDIIFFDTEDQGVPRFMHQNASSTNTWCLGSQYWSRNPHTTNYYARYGILLDMVGAQNALFPMESYSMQFAPDVVKRIWNLASNMGYSNYFVFDKTGPLTDDHYFVNTIAGIPCIDIIHYHPSNKKGFGDFWHTHDDNISVIHKPTIFAVGSVLLEHLYQQPF